MLVEFKNRKTGAAVMADFPLAVFPSLVVPQDPETGLELAHMAPADFLAAYAQVLPDLPPVDPATVPKGDTAAAIDLKATPPHVPLEMFEMFASYVSSEFGKLHAILEGLEAAHPKITAALEELVRLAKFAVPNATPPAPPAPPAE